MIKILIFAFIFFFAACNSDYEMNASYFVRQYENGTGSTYKKGHGKNNELLYTSTVYGGSTYETKLTYDSGYLQSIKGYLLDNLYGHNFNFYDNGRLKLYSYYVGNEMNSSYIRRFSKDGHLESEQGSPFVDAMSTSIDTVELFFSTVFCNKITVEYFLANGKKSELELTSSTMQPMLLSGKVLKTENTLYLNTITFDKITKKNISYIDSISTQ